MATIPYETALYVPPHLRETGQEIVKRRPDCTKIVTPRLSTLTEQYEKFKVVDEANEITQAKLVLPNHMLTINTGMIRRVIVLKIDAIKLKIVDNQLVEQYPQHARDRCTIRYRAILTLDLKRKASDMDARYQGVIDAIATFNRENADLAPARTYAERLCERLRTEALEGRKFKLIVRESRCALNIEQRTNHVVMSDGTYAQDQVTFVRLNLARPLLEQCNELNLI